MFKLILINTLLALGWFMFIPVGADAAVLSGNAAYWARSIHTQEPSPSGSIAVHFGPCPSLPGSGGCAMPWISTIYVPDRNVFAVEHEMGHFFDVRDLTDADRARIVMLIGFSASTPWQNPDRWTDGDPYCLKTACPNEQFANVYAACTLGLKMGHYIAHGANKGEFSGTWYDPSPPPALTKRHYGQICDLIGAKGWDVAGTGAAT